MNQSERRLFLIQSLLKEKSEYRDMDIPAETENRRQLLRGLMNIRAPQSIGADFLQVQDDYLKAETAAKGITDLADLLPPFSRGCISGRATSRRSSATLS